jgi:DNA-binding GntR family transcriptional regulator
MAQPEHILPAEFFVDLDRSSPVPLYFQISQRLERAIRNDLLRPGSRLENEVSLGQRYGFSRPTVRRALQVLVDKGLLVRRRGIGTQVVHGQVTRSVELTSLFEDLGRTGQNPTTKVTGHEIGTADSAVAQTLGIAEGDRVLHITRLRYADGVPLAILENTLPSDFTDFTASDLETLGLYQLLRTRGVTMSVADQRIGARSASPTESELLELPKGAALLTMTRTAFDNSGRAVEFGRHVYSPDLYSFQITLVEK